MQCAAGEPGVEDDELVVEDEDDDGGTVSDLLTPPVISSLSAEISSAAVGREVNASAQSDGSTGVLSEASATAQSEASAMQPKWTASSPQLETTATGTPSSKASSQGEFFDSHCIDCKREFKVSHLLYLSVVGR